MKILLLTDTYPPFINGVSTSTYNLRNALIDHGHEVLVVAPRVEDGEFEYKDGIIWLPGISLKKLYGYRLTSIYPRKAIKIIKEFKPDILHFQTDFTIGQFSQILARQLDIPTVYTYHTSYEDYTYYATKGFLDRVAKKTVRAYSKNLAVKVSEFITPSKKTKDFMRSTGSDIYINVIPTGIDFSLFDEEKIDKEKMANFKKEHNISESTKTFLLLGRIAKEKSMDVSIRGFAKYHELHPEEDKKLLVVGGGPQKAELELLVHELNIAHIVDFIGPVPADDVPFYYHLADIYTSASLTETQGLTFMEAVSAKCLVLARFDDNLSGTIIDGLSGYFFTDENSFVKKCERIFSLSEEEKEKIINKALEIVDVYSIEKFYENIIGVYNRAIRKCW
jgi:1,2-diacylglycerol 3-alpha-glucosyltransferase